MTEVRVATSADAYAVARVHVRSWQAAYQGLIDRDYLESLTPETWARRYTFGRVGLRVPSTLVAVDSGGVYGLATTGLSRDDDLPNFGELMAIYVDPDYLGMGIGRLLIAAARQRLRVLGVGGAALWVLRENTRAQRFYERDGWQPDGASRTGSYGGGSVAEARYRRTPV